MAAIIKKELVSYFKNPIGYIVIGAYSLITGIFFVISVISNMQTYMGTYFGSYMYFANLVLVALISFKFFSEEKKNGTDTLLLTSPVRVSGLVLGKFVSGALIFTAATLVNIIYVLLICMFGTVYTGEFIMQMLGSLLIGYSMIAVALFISSVTDNQIGTVAATSAVLLLMFIIDSISRLLPPLIGVPLSYLSLYSRFSDFAIGLFNPAPTVYYLSVIAVFLFLTMRMIEKRRWA